MKLIKSGGSYYTDYKNLIRLRPRYVPSGEREILTEPDRSGLIWDNATMDWEQLIQTWEEIS